MQWNRTFTDLIRNGRAAYWGNWTLAPTIKLGAAGFVSPDTGDFMPVKLETPGVAVSTRIVPNQWKLSANNVHRTETSAKPDGSATDPESGTKINAGVEVKWEFSSVGSTASEFGIASESYISDLTQLTRPEATKWLAEQAQFISMGSGDNIAQGFDVVTSVILASSGLNVGSQDDNASFSIVGSAGAVHDMLGSATGKGSFVSVNQTKNVDQHLWLFEPGKQTPAPIPVAYTFASLDGDLLIPDWITCLGGFEIYFNSKPGGTYVTHIRLRFSTSRGLRSDKFSLSSGISKTVANIPLNATDIQVDMKFQGVVNSDNYPFRWSSPLGQWLTGRCEIEMTGVWPGPIHAIEK